MGELTRREHNGIVIMQRADGTTNATAMCKACGKKANDYFRSKETKAYVDHLSTETGIPVSQLVETVKGNHSDGRDQGTWVHELIAYNLAQWCSPAFAVKVSMWLRDLHTTGHASIDATGGSHVDTMASVLLKMVSVMESFSSRLDRMEGQHSAPYGGTVVISDRLNELLAIHEMRVKAGWIGKVVQGIAGECLNLSIPLVRRPGGLLEMPLSHLPWAESVMMRHIRQWRESNRTPLLDSMGNIA